MNNKNFKIPAEELFKLIESDIGCIASDMITVQGKIVNYMYREEPKRDFDSGWRFFSGEEDQAYTDNEDNFSYYKVNTIANYDSVILNYLDYPVDSYLERIAGTNQFVLMEDTSNIDD